MSAALTRRCAASSRRSSKRKPGADDVAGSVSDRRGGGDEPDLEFLAHDRVPVGASPGSSGRFWQQHGGRRPPRRGLDWSGHAQRVAELGGAALDELDQLLLDRLVERRADVAGEQLAHASLAARGVIEHSAARPAIEVVRRRDRRAPEALAEARERVLAAEEMAAVADLDVRVEGETRIVDLERRELLEQQIEQLRVGDELGDAR